jgi:hypothetical protein
MKKLLMFCSLWAAAVAFSSLACAAANGSAFSHVYYLFIVRPKGCEECYVPMVITREPIDAKRLATGNMDNVAIITYERDSIWEIKKEPAKFELPLEHAAVALRQLRWNGSDYRYQEVDKGEALRLLRNPMGTVPISRPMPPVTLTPAQRDCVLRQASGIKDPACPPPFDEKALISRLIGDLSPDSARKH